MRIIFSDHALFEMLLRVIGKEKEDMFYVITVYKTSKIEKYLDKGEDGK